MVRSDASETSGRRSGPRKIGEIVPQLLARRGYARLLAHDEFQTVWQQASGSFSQFSRAGQLRRGVLEVIVSNSVVRQELTFQKRQLLSQLSESLPQHNIRDLRFKVGTID